MPELLRFSELLRFYRQRCVDSTTRGGKLSQARLGELVGHELGLAQGYSGAAVSEWELGHTKIGADDRRLLITLIKIFHAYGGLHTPAEADTLLLAGNYRPLNEAERRQLFGAEAPEPDHPAGPEPGSTWHIIVIFLGQLLIERAHGLKTLLDEAAQGPPPHWPHVLIALIGWPFRDLSPENILRGVFWVAAWLLAFSTLIPFLYWPQGSLDQAQAAVLGYIGGSCLLPALIGTLTASTQQDFWKSKDDVLPGTVYLFAAQGAYVGFQLGFMTVFAAALAGYYLGIGPAPNLLQAFFVLWPIILSYAAARQIPFNMWRAYGRLRFTAGDTLILAAFFAFGPAWAFFFLIFGHWLLRPELGVTLILVSIAMAGAVENWRARRARR